MIHERKYWYGLILALLAVVPWAGAQAASLPTGQLEVVESPHD